MDQRSFHPGAEHHQRRLELVAGIGGEAVQAPEALLQPREHAVHREGQPGHLVARERYRQAPVQAPAVGDGFHLVHDSLHRPKTGTCEPVPHQPGSHQDDRRDQQHGSQQIGGTQRSLPGRGGDQDAPDDRSGTLDRHRQETHCSARGAQRQGSAMSLKAYGIERSGQTLQGVRAQRAGDFR